MRSRKPDQWTLAVEAWKSGAAVTDFMRDQLAGLRDADGDPLPEVVRAFLADLIFCKIKPRKGRPISKTIIKESYRTRLFFAQMTEQTDRGATPSERVIQDLAKELNLSEATVSAIVHPRKARQS